MSLSLDEQRLMQTQSEHTELEAENVRLKRQLEEAESALYWASRFIETVPAEKVEGLVYDDDDYDPERIAFSLAESQHVDALKAYAKRWEPSFAPVRIATVDGFLGDLETAKAEFAKSLAMLREVEGLLALAETYFGTLPGDVVFDVGDEDNNPAAVAFHTAMAQYDDARAAYLTHWDGSGAEETAATPPEELREYEAVCARLTRQIIEAKMVLQWAERFHGTIPEDVIFDLEHDSPEEAAFHEAQTQFIKALDAYKKAHASEEAAE